MTIKPTPLFCSEACANADTVRSFSECPGCKNIWDSNDAGNWDHYRNNAWAICNTCSRAQSKCARCGSTLVNLTIDYEAIMDDLSPSSDTVDLSTANGKLLILAGFGNGIFTEIRVVGHSTEAVLYFVRLIQGGGYGQFVFDITVDRKLHETGDACFPADNPFVFVSPVTTTGDSINFHTLELETLKRADEIAGRLQIPQIPAEDVPVERPSWMSTAKPAKQWWKFW